jgi:hypothetical protein
MNAFSRGANAQALREGDLGENAGESFFPTSATETNCDGEMIDSEPLMRLGEWPRSVSSSDLPTHPPLLLNR